MTTNRLPPSSSSSTTKLCLGLDDVCIALILVLLIITTVFGNILVISSVICYKKMRTFTNILLASLATPDLLVGVVVMPLSLVDLLHDHAWPFSRFLCSMWATLDVLLCTASILNLCVISLDRYMAITSPLKYSRTRSKKTASLLLGAVWIISLIVCSPPWFVPGWGLMDSAAIVTSSTNRSLIRSSSNRTLYANIRLTTKAPPIDCVTTSTSAQLLVQRPFMCAYPHSITYRIYSALGSFFIPLLVMLSVYFKIFRVASDRETLMRSSMGTYRLSHKIMKDQQKRGNKFANTSSTATSNHNVSKSAARHQRNSSRTASVPTCRQQRVSIATTTMHASPVATTSIDRRSDGSMTIGLRSPGRLKYATTNRQDSMFSSSSRCSRIDSIDDGFDDIDAQYSSMANQDKVLPPASSSSSTTVLETMAAKVAYRNGPGSIRSGGRSMNTISIERECHSLADLDDEMDRPPMVRKNTEIEVPMLSKRAQMCHNRMTPSNLLQAANDHYHTYGPGKITRGSKEKMVYLRERKALKTIGIVVLGFITCWMPFFILYLVEVLVADIGNNLLAEFLADLFLWLGYSNSALNPIIYTMYNGDFRRCFRDLLSFGCVQHHRRSMSVRKLHQQSIF